MSSRADKRQAKREASRKRRRERGGRSTFVVGLFTIVLIGIVVFAGFTKKVPFHHDFRVNAVFTESNSIRKNSPVRIAGVNVGKVTGVKRQPGTTAAIVEMQIQKKGLPIHQDATLKIRPRIFLEGNFFVDIQPGTPDSKTLKDNDTIAVTQTSTPVQLDQVLSALQSNTREDLQAALEGYGTALTHKPTAAEDADSDPATRGETAAKSLNDTFKTGPDALKDLSIVNEATLGTQTHDLSRLIKGLGTVTTALDRNESNLQGFVHNFNTTLAAFASQSTSLRSSIRLLGPTLQTTNRALTSLNNAFPNVRAFSREILPGVRETPATINAAFPWIRQTRGLLQQSELRGLTQDLRPTTANLSKVTDTTIGLLPQLDLVSQCATKVILPTGDIKIDDGSLSSNTENYKEFWYSMVGLAGEGSNFDGNGPYVRFAVGGGDQTVSTGKFGGSGGDQLFGRSGSKPLGTRPAYPGRRPPYNPTAPCKDQKIPDLDDARTGAADASSTSSSSTSPGITVPGVGTLPIPTLPLTRSAKSRATGTPAQAKAPSLSSQIASTLNPFRKATVKP